MPRYVYSPAYAVDIGPHVFPTSKYARILDRLVREDGVLPGDVVEPEVARAEDVQLVHTADYYTRCRDGELTPWEVMQLELPWSAPLFEASARCVQGSILAARLALDHGAGLHIGGGFHHAFADHGEGFCVFNDVAVAVRRMQADGRIRRALVVDCDLHHGNGTASIFAGDEDVATFSIHQGDIYPAVKPPSTVDVALASGTGDDEYLAQVEMSFPPLFESHGPELVVYVAGADPYREDQLGSLQLSQEGLARRDRIVVEACRDGGCPVMVVLAGGYARRSEDTVQIHLQSLRTVASLWVE